MADIKKLRKVAGLTQQKLAKLIGTSNVHLGRIESGKVKLTKEWADKMSPHLNIDSVELLYGGASRGNTVKVIGAVQAGAWREALEWPIEDQYDVTIYDDRYDNVFALQVIGDSMNTLYVQGTVLVCRPFDEVNEFPPIGKRVIVQRRNATGQIEATVKELELVDGQPWLMPKSSNPIYEGVQFKNNGDGDDDTQIIGVVVGSYLRE